MKNRVIDGNPLEFFNSSNEKKGEIRISGSDIIINPEDSGGTVIFGEEGSINDIEIGASGTTVDFTFLGGGTIAAGGNTLILGESGDTIDLSNATIGTITASIFKGGNFEGDGSGLTNLPSAFTNITASGNVSSSGTGSFERIAVGDSPTPSTYILRASNEENTAVNLFSAKRSSTYEFSLLSYAQIESKVNGTLTHAIYNTNTGATTPLLKLGHNNAGIAHITTYYSDNSLNLSGSHGVHVLTNFTASGNISASGTIIADDIVVGGTTVDGSGLTANGRFVAQSADGSDWFTVGKSGAGIVVFNSQGGTTQAGGTDLGARFNIQAISDSVPVLAIRGQNGSSDLVRVNSHNVTTGDYLNIKNDGKVGIGTTSPLGLFQLDEYTVASQGSNTAFGVSSIFANSGATGLYIGVKNAAYPNRGYGFKVTTAGVNSDFTIVEHGLSGDRFTIKTGGRVGIGTSSPYAKLHLSGSDDAAESAIRQSRAGRGIWDQAIDSNGRLQWGYRAAGSEGGTRTVTFTLDDNNRVAMGFSHTPDKLLHVSGSDSDASILLERSTNDALIETRTNSAGAYFRANSVGSSNYYGLELNNDTTGNWFLGSYGYADFSIVDGSKSSGTRQFTVKNTTGNVGIGTTSPGEKLQVAGNISASGDVQLTNGSDRRIRIGYDLEDGDGNIKLKLYNSNDFDGTLTTYQYNSVLDLKAGVSGSSYQDNWTRIRLQDHKNGNGQLSFWISGSEAARFTPDGNFGIGTTSPTDKLDVNGIVRVGSGGAWATSTGAVQLSYNSATSQGVLSTYFDTTSLRLGAGISQKTGITINGQSNANGNNIIFRAGNSDRMIITGSTGNVGIGTTTPSGELHVSNTSDFYTDLDGTDSAIVFKEAGGNPWRIGNKDSDDSFRITQNATSLNTSTRVTIANGGNVGIGTTTPGEKLEVVGDISASGDININNNSSYKGKHTNGSEYGLLTLTNGNVVKVGAYDYTSASTVFGGGDNTQFLIGASEVMRMRSTGLEVTGQITASGNISSTGNIEINNAGNGQIDVSRNSGANVRIQAQASTGVVGTTTNHALHLKTNDSTKWYISTGGTLAPQADSSYDIGTTSVRVANIYADTLYGDGSNLTGILAVASLNASSSTLQSNIDAKASIAQLNASSSALQSNIDAKASIAQLNASSSTLQSNIDGKFSIDTSTGENMIGSLDPDSITGTLVGRTGTNNPAGTSQDGAIINLYKSTTEVAQIWVGMFGDRGRMYVRNKDGGSYQNWIKIINKNDLNASSSALQSNIDGKLASSAVSTFGGTLIDDANASTARATLELGSSDDVTFGTISATSLTVTSITSSIVTSSILQTEGSNIFGDASTDTHTFNGNITASGNISASGNLIVGDTTINGEMVFGSKQAYTLPAQGTRMRILQIADHTLCRVYLESSENGYHQPIVLDIFYRAQSTSQKPQIVRSENYEWHAHSNDIIFTSDGASSPGADTYIYAEKVAHSTGRPVNIRKIEVFDGTLTVLDGSTTDTNGGTDETIQSTFAELRVVGDISASGGIQTGFGSFSAGIDSITDAAIIIPENKAIYTKDSSGQYFRKLLRKATDVIEVGQSGTSLIDEIRFLPGNAGFTTFYGDSTEVARVDVAGNITASGNISASGTIQGLTGSFSEGRFTGNVGIGTTSPSKELHIKSYAPRLLIEGTGASAENEEISRVSGLWDGTYVADIQFLAGDDTSNKDNGKIAFRTYTSDGSVGTRMLIDEAGNVGIGTSSPNYKLDVDGEILSDGLRLNLSATTQRAITSTGTDSIQIGDAGVNELKFKNTAGTSMMIAASGNVGIGETSPSDVLHVSQSTDAFRGITIEGPTPALYLKDTGASSAHHIGSNGGYLYFLEDSNLSGGYNNIMGYFDASNNFVFNDGNVGIGTSAFPAKLTVQGGISASGDIEIKVGAASAQGLIFRENGTQTMGIKYQGGQSSNPIDIFRYEDNTTKVRFQENGNVGIGTTSPGEKLTIQNTNSIVKFGNIQTTFSSSGTSAVPDVLIKDKDNSDTRAALQVQGNNGSAEVLFAASSGRVGIGTVTPESTLDVNGTITLAGDTEHQILKHTLSTHGLSSGQTTSVFGRNVFLNAYDDVILRAGSSDDIRMYAGSDSIVRLNISQHGHITASNNISASGNIVANNATFAGTVTANGTTLTGATDISGKQDTITGAATTIVSSNLGTSKALISNGSGKVAVSNTTKDELEYLSGVTSAVQTQIDAKASIAQLNASSSALQSNINGKQATITDGDLTIAKTNGLQDALDGKQDGLTFGISNTNVLRANANVSNDDFLRVDGTSIEGRSASEVKSDIGLSAVENTAISTFAGSTNITTIGTLDSLTVDTHITASGNIRAAGHVSASQIILAGGPSITYESNFLKFDNGGAATAGYQYGRGNIVNNHSFGGHITASGNITASGLISLGDGGHLFGGKRLITGEGAWEFRDGTLTAAGGLIAHNVTASGEISASGEIYSDNIETFWTSFNCDGDANFASSAYGPNTQGINYYHWNKNWSSTTSDGGDPTGDDVHRTEINSGWYVPYKIRVVGFVGGLHDGSAASTTTCTVKLFNTVASFASSDYDTNTGTTKALVASSGTVTLNGNRWKHYNVSGLNVILEEGQYILPRITMGENLTNLRGQFTIKYKRVV